jgi:Golgi SNAP receptor complex protein 2
MKKLDELKNLLEENASIPIATASLDSLQQSIGDLQKFAKSEVDASRREIGLLRVKKLQQEAGVLQESINLLKAKAQERISLERNSLLGKFEESPSTILDIDYFNKESGILDASGDRIEEFIGLGKTALQDLYEQRSMLKVILVFKGIVY